MTTQNAKLVDEIAHAICSYRSRPCPGSACGPCADVARRVLAIPALSAALSPSRPDPGTVEMCAKRVEQLIQPESGTEYGLMSETERSKLRSFNRILRTVIAAIRALGGNAAP